MRVIIAMSVLPADNRHTPMSENDNLEFKRDSELKHEFIDGEIWAMSGASRQHNLIVPSMNFVIYGQLRGHECEIYPSDMKVRPHLPAPIRILT